MSQIIIESTTGNLLSLLNDNVKPILFLGAGASIKSGIPTTTEFVEKAALWTYAKENFLDPDDPQIKRSDWLPWLKGMSWYDVNKPQADNYPAVVDNLLQPKQRKKDFFTRILKPGIPPSRGYVKLAELIGKGLIKTVLTTNFDTILVQACNTNPLVHDIEEIKFPNQYIQITTSPSFAQVIYLHGSVDNYSDKNNLNEIERLDEQLVDRITPVIRDHPLIVVGYRGAENSVMNHLLIENAEKADFYKHGIYWCVLDHQKIEEFTPQIRTLATVIGRNFQLIRIKGFDELFDDEIGRRIQIRNFTSESDKKNIKTSISDLQVTSEASFDDLDGILLRQRIISYCNALNIWTPEHITDSWLRNMAVERDLCLKHGETIRPTNAGIRLFGKTNNLSLFGKVVIRVAKNPVWLHRIFVDFDESEFRYEQTVEGNLWSQLDAIIEIVGEFNKPFRLKGEISEQVYPYHPLALKELIVNSLVHRDYNHNEGIIILIEPTHIKITNPGGLVEEVKAQLNTSIEAEIKKGMKGIKGYRNPVIADLFYGSGAMDKAGSGLSDAYGLTKKNAGDLSFGPTANNLAFEAIIFSRPEAIDEQTQTASPVSSASIKFSSNVLEIVQIPRRIWQATTESKSIKDVWEHCHSDWLPPFVVRGNKILSFHELGILNNPITAAIDRGSLESFETESFFDDEDSSRILVDLLNRTFIVHLEALGLIVDKVKKRAYYPSKDEENFSIKYKARLKAATRTITKKRISPSTQQVRYWEHKSFSFRFEKFSQQWGLIINPGYVFSLNGFRKLLLNEKINRLSTKRASRDYNQHYLNDLIFWSWVLSEGSSNYFDLKTLPEHAQSSFDEDAIIKIASTYVKASINSFSFEESEDGSFNEDDNEIFNEIDRLLDEEDDVEDQKSDTEDEH